jgi:hypothetical protein
MRFNGITTGVMVTLLTAGFTGRGWAQSARAQPPPLKIFFAESPALLIQIDGDPVYRPVAGTSLERIINTRALIVRDRANVHYLKVLDGWMEAHGLMGEWSVSGVTPLGDKPELEGPDEPKTIDVFEESGSSTAAARAPEDKPPAIFVSSRPAALIVTDGPPQYDTLNGTSLEYVVNTTANVFREPRNQELYVLVDGRWFRAPRSDGPWADVPTDQLPADIALWYAGKH